MSEQERPIPAHMRAFADECAALSDRVQDMLVGQPSPVVLVALGTILCAHLGDERFAPLPPLLEDLRILLAEAITRIIASTPKATLQ